MMSRIETKRLILRQFTINDAAFIRQLVNDPTSIQHIGDRGVRSLADAREYLSQGSPGKLCTKRLRI
jgi:ribosomal-protein-alanine N-acetyltransferase